MVAPSKDNPGPDPGTKLSDADLRMIVLLRDTMAIAEATILALEGLVDRHGEPPKEYEAVKEPVRALHAAAKAVRLAGAGMVAAGVIVVKAQRGTQNEEDGATGA